MVSMLQYSGLLYIIQYIKNQESDERDIRSEKERMQDNFAIII